MKTHKYAKRWTEAEAAQILDEVDASGLPDMTFGRSRGISGQRLHWWRQRLGRRRPVAARGRAAGQPRFVEVVAAREAAITENERIEVRLRNGRSLLIGMRTAPELIGRIAAELEKLPC